MKCPKCGGFVYKDDDGTEKMLKCLNCSWYKYTGEFVYKYKRIEEIAWRR